MKRTAVLATFFLQILSAQVPLGAQNVADSDSSDRLSQSVRSPLVLLFDPALTMRSGSETIITLHHGITRAEDALLGTHWFSEDNFIGKTGGVLARFAKLAILDVPVDYFSVVLSHEYIGHGARYRELGIDNVHYAFDPPPPYGKGGGEASVSLSGNVISYHEWNGITLGGLEVHSLINRNLGLRWMARKEIQYREALQYFWSWQIDYVYVQETTEDLTSNVKDNDPRAYIRILNRDNGYADPNNPHLTVRQLKSMAKLNLANPFVVFAMFAGLKTYLWDGNRSTELPTLRFGEVDYLPVLRAGWTPFGPDFHLENYLRFGNRVSLVEFKIGDQTFHKSWGGIGVGLRNMCSRGRFSADMHLDVWKQPALRFGGIPGTSKGGGVGGAFSVRGYYDFDYAGQPLVAVLELGYKSVGFLEGYPFDSSPVFRIGIGLRE
ncbi:MAG: hypothetical protein FJ217_12145 [Ignavibacteria bacterium]|nr:hypothetical protein [Ignavibacteria bacterium]